MGSVFLRVAEHKFGGDVVNVLSNGAIDVGFSYAIKERVTQFDHAKFSNK